MKIKKLFINNWKRSIYYSARNCFNKGDFSNLEGEYTKDKALKLTKCILLKNHSSIFEHCIYQFYLEDVSRSFLAQLSRHRVGMSLTVKSQHYINHKGFKFKDLETNDSNAKILYAKTMRMIGTAYDMLIDNHEVPHYIAREVLPNSALCNIFITINLREIIHILDLRIGKENTPEIRKFAFKLFLDLEKSEPEIMKLIDGEYSLISRSI